MSKSEDAYIEVHQVLSNYIDEKRKMMIREMLNKYINKRLDKILDRLVDELMDRVWWKEMFNEKKEMAITFQINPNILNKKRRKK